ncbi:metal-dependent hydrolase [Herbiconiux sp. P18]|uniref:metal-dependent hydrolase n=1 Tax=Herbiconiux liangxiaofengii TaxID=3342795 RepID=UPI0035B8635C
MALPRQDTLITYPDGQTTQSDVVVHREVLPDGRVAVLLGSTPFHPVDPTWPDQGPDRGMLVTAEAEHPVIDCRVGATDGDELHLGERLPVRLGTEGWAFVVAHIVDAGSDLAEGTAVTAVVDAGHRRALSEGHTLCHLASLALNRALAGFWSKEVATDALGSPDFDQTAIASSSIRAHGSVDVYRLGKSLRKKGFDSARLSTELDAVAEAVQVTLAGWVAGDAEVAIRRESPELSARRTWWCGLPEGEAAIPCGGTHVERLGALEHPSIVLELDDEGTALTMTTRKTT